MSESNWSDFRQGCDAVYGVRLILGGFLGALSLWIIALNWSAIVKEYVLKRPTGSWIPLVGGVAGVAAIFVLPVAEIHRYWVIPLFADWGSIPGLVHTLLFYARARRR